MNSNLKTFMCFSVIYQRYLERVSGFQSGDESTDYLAGEAMREMLECDLKAMEGDGYWNCIWVE